MKKKLLLLIIIATILTFLIYKTNYHNNILITSINSLDNDNNYNELLLNKLTNYKVNIDYSDASLEIENLISHIEHNTNKIQQVLYKSKVIILSIGNIDLQNEKIKNILDEYNSLFKLIRKYNKYEIIFISPKNLIYQKELKNLCNKHNILYINSNSYLNNNMLLTAILQKIPYIK